MVLEKTLESPLDYLLGGAASLLTVVFTLLAIKKGGRIPQWLSVVRLVAAAGLMLTFLTVAAFLGPLYGYDKMFLGSNLWFHLIVPLLCAGGVLLLRGERIPKKHLLFCLVPILLYGAFYLGNIAINGVGTRPNSNDWYSLLNWGIGVGLFLLAGMLVFLLGSGALLRLGYNRNNRK